MGKKISLVIGSRKFDLDVENEFAVFLQHQMSKDFNVEGNNDLKLLLQAYVKKNHDLFTQEREMKRILQKLQK